MTARRFPPPWRVVEIPGGYAVEDAEGQRLAYCYARERAHGASDHSLTPDEARRIAANIAKLPQLLASADRSR